MPFPIEADGNVAYYIYLGIVGIITTIGYIKKGRNTAMAINDEQPIMPIEDVATLVTTDPAALVSHLIDSPDVLEMNLTLTTAKKTITVEVKNNPNADC